MLIAQVMNGTPELSVDNTRVEFLNFDVRVDDIDAESNAREARVDRRIFDRPHLVKQLEVAHEGVVFPLRDEYRRINYTLEGRREAYSKSGDFDTLLWPKIRRTLRLLLIIGCP